LVQHHEPALVFVTHPTSGHKHPPARETNSEKEISAGEYIPACFLWGNPFESDGLHQVEPWEHECCELSEDAEVFDFLPAIAGFRYRIDRKKKVLNFCRSSSALCSMVAEEQKFPLTSQCMA